jgi:hypothetical protein
MKVLAQVIGSLLIFISIAFVSPTSHATVLTFEAGTDVFAGGIWTYTEAGFVIEQFGGKTVPSSIAPLSPIQSDGSGGHFLAITDAATDILIARADHSPFTPVSVTNGGRDTRFGGFHGDFVTGGQAPDVAFSPGGVGSTLLFAGNPNWQNITTIDWCNYCVELGFNGGSIDNLVVDVSAVPEPSTWVMMILGLLGLGFIACRRKAKPALIAA